MGFKSFSLVIFLFLAACASHAPRSSSTGIRQKSIMYKPINTLGEVGLNCLQLEAPEEELDRFALTSPEILVQYTQQIQFPMIVGEGIVRYCERFMSQFTLKEGKNYRKVKVTRFPITKSPSHTN